MSARKELGEALKPALESGWKLALADREFDEFDGVVVLVSQRTLVPAPTNPDGGHRATMFVYVAASKSDPDAAEDELDDAVDTVCYGIDRIRGIRWTEAEKTTYQGRRSYRITVEAFTKRKAEQ